MSTLIFKFYFFELIIFIFKFLPVISNTCLFNGDRFYAQNKDEDFIKTCLGSHEIPIYWITLDSCNLIDVKNIIRVVKDISAIKKLEIFNSNIKNVNLSGLKLIKLKLLNVTRNNIEQFTLGYFPNLTIMDVSNNQLQSLSLSPNEIAKLQELDLSHNDFHSLKIYLDEIKNINLSNSISPNISSLSKSFQKNINSIDLSYNYLENVKFLHFFGSVKEIILHNNNIVNFEDFKEGFKDTELYLGNNFLQCSMNLAMDWLILKNKNIVFEEDLTCSFVNSHNKYLINKYGWMMSNETTILDKIWSDTLFSVFLEFNSSKFLMDADMQGLIVYWKIPNLPNRSGVLKFKSEKGNEMHSETITMKELEGKIYIKFTKMSQVAEVCLMFPTRKLTFDGYGDVYINVYCKNITSQFACLSAHGTFYFYFTISISILSFIILILLLFMCFCYWSKWRHLRPVSSNITNIELRSKNNIIDYDYTEDSRNVYSSIDHDTYYRDSKTNLTEFSDDKFLSRNKNQNFYISMNTENVIGTSNDFYDLNM